MRSSLGLALLVATVAHAENVPLRLPATEVMPFEDAVQKAVTRNPAVQVAVDEIERARALVEQTRAGALPQLSANLAYTRIEGDRRSTASSTGAMGMILVPSDQVNANLSLLVPIVATRSWVQWSHAKQNVEVSRANAEDVRRQLAFTTARTYLSILTQHRVVEVAERALA